MEEQQNLVKLAKQGNTKALAALMNHSLQTKGITVKINFTNDCFMVIAESAEPPDQSFLVDFVRKGIKNLNTEVIKRVIIRGHATGQTVPAWREAFDLDSNISEKQVQISKSINNGVYKRETLSHQSRIQSNFFKKILNIVQENRQFERLALVITTFLLTSSAWAIVGFRNSILPKADSSLTSSLVTLNKKHTIQGDLTIQDMELGVSPGGSCSGKEGYQDVEQGGDIAVKNSKGEIIGNASLSAGKYIDVEESLSSEAEKARWKELKNESRDLPSAFYCHFNFTVENIPETNFYFIEIGHRKGPTYSLEDMNNKGWKMNLSLGK